MLGVIPSDDTQGYLRKSKSAFAIDKLLRYPGTSGGGMPVMLVCGTVCQNGMKNGMLSKGVLYLYAYRVDDDDKLYLISV
jgi:hypothetical protein